MNTLARRTLHAFGWRAPVLQLAAEPAASPAAQAAPLLQVWSRQLAEASGEGTAAVDDLSRSFAGIERQLAGAVKSARDAAAAFGGDGATAGVLRQARERLDAMVAHIEKAVLANHELLASIRDAVQAAAELRETAHSVERIAQMTTMLSINARIESARAGAAGAGFAVVAGEVHRLAGQAREDALAIVERVDRISSVVTAAATAGDALRQRDEQLMRRCRGEIGDVAQSFGDALGGLHAEADTMAGIAGGLQGSVAQALLGLQFQDRVAQRLGHVQASVEALAGGLADGWPDAESLAALETRLLASYTMPEESRTHRGEAAPADEADGLTFF